MKKRACFAIAMLATACAASSSEDAESANQDVTATPAGAIAQKTCQSKADRFGEGRDVMVNAKAVMSLAESGFGDPMVQIHITDGTKTVLMDKYFVRTGEDGSIELFDHSTGAGVACEKCTHSALKLGKDSAKLVPTAKVDRRFKLWFQDRGIELQCAPGTIEALKAHAKKR
jgi:hypothetical protein